MTFAKIYDIAGEQLLATLDQLDEAEEHPYAVAYRIDPPQGGSARARLLFDDVDVARAAFEDAETASVIGSKLYHVSREL